MLFPQLFPTSELPICTVITGNSLAGSGGQYSKLDFGGRYITIDEAGNILTKSETPQSVDNYIIAKQKEKPHWTAPTVPAGGESMRPIREGGSMADEQADIAALL